MAWPSPQDYNEAVQSPRTAFQEPELQQGSPELDPRGLPRPRSGSFATVYKILCGKRNWAVRCFLNPTSDHQERYAATGAVRCDKRASRKGSARIFSAVQLSYAGNPSWATNVSDPEDGMGRGRASDPLHRKKPT